METKNVIYELRTQKGLSQEELAAKVFVQDKLFRAGKLAKLSRIRIRSNFFLNCLTCRSILSSVLRESWFANVAGCLWKTTI